MSATTRNPVLATMARAALVALSVVPILPAQQPRHVPSIDELIELRTASAAQLSPDGRRVAYLVSEADWKADAFITQIFLVSSDGGDSRQLTRGAKSATLLRWSPDGQWISFASPRTTDKPQLFIIRPDGGEAIQLTNVEDGVLAYEWAPDSRTIAFTATEPSPGLKDRKSRYSEFDVVRRDYQNAHLFTLNIAEAMREPVKGTQHTHGTAYSVGGLSWAPDGSRIAFAAQLNPDLVQSSTADIYVLSLAGDSVTRVVDQPGPDLNPIWSPDGKAIAFTSNMGRKPYFSTNRRLAVVRASGGEIRSLTDAFDEDPTPIAWTADGIYFSALARTAVHLFRVNPQTAAIVRVSGPDGGIYQGSSIARDGHNVAFVLSSPSSAPEVAVSSVMSWAPRILTHMTDQAHSLVLGTRELIQWKSNDGAAIEGVLIKPVDFDPKRKYPLLVRIHGGPTGTDRPVLFSDRTYYPLDVWVDRGALALQVNYRGSAGYGERFRMLNRRNLGIGDAWDVLSGVDFLIARGWVDPARIGVMGWSQGGYISAFLTTTSTRFAAVSVGAGISDWATYYYNTDITPFTIDYLGGDPTTDPDIYRKTSPITYVSQARTPTLIQQGDLDKRVPVANSYELRQALEDRHVPVEMILYKGFGHPINKPKAQRAVMTHNLAWFNHYLWGDPLGDLRTPAIGVQTSQSTTP